MLALEHRNILHRIIFPKEVLATLVFAYPLDSWLFTQTRLFHSTHLVSIQDPFFLFTAVSGFVLFANWLILNWITY